MSPALPGGIPGHTAALSAGVVGAGDGVLQSLRDRPAKAGQARFFYMDNHFHYAAVKVLPGEYYVTSDDVLLVTVLGSCIAACVWDSVARVGGMNHFMLPDSEGGESSGRYGSYAMELLINEMMQLGARRETMQAKVFGGGRVMAGLTTMNIGEKNTDFVLSYLEAERIPVVSQDVLDIHPRKVCFFPVTGKALVKRLAHSHPEVLVVEERRGNAATLAQKTSGGSVDLF